MTLCDPMGCNTPDFHVLHHLQSLLKLMSIEPVMPSNHLILCHPLPLLPSIFPSIRVFFNESVLRIRWPKCWSFSFKISPSNEYSGLTSFRVDWLDLLAHFGCSGSWKLCRLFSGCSEWGLLSSCNAQASHCAGFSSCRAQALERRPNSCGAGASLLCSTGDLPATGIKPTFRHWQVDSLQVSHQGSPFLTYFLRF